MARTITISVTDEDFQYLKKKKPAKTVREALNLHKNIRIIQDFDNEEPLTWVQSLKNKLAFFL